MSDMRPDDDHDSPREVLAEMTRDAEDMQHVDGLDHGPSNVCRAHGPLGGRNIDDSDVASVWPSCRLCGQELMTQAQVREAAKGGKPAAFGTLTPKVAHEVMLRATGQPQYPTSAELTQQARDDLAAAQLPTQGEYLSSRQLAELCNRSLDFAIVEAEARKLTSILPKAEFDAVIADAITGHMAAEERRLAAAIPAGLPPGDAIVFELRHVGEVALTVQVLTERKVFDGWPELVEQVGAAMKRLVANTVAAIVAAKAMTDANGERKVDGR